MAILERLTAHSDANATTTVFAPTVVRFGPALGVSLMNRRRGGWGERSYTYSSLWSLARCWRLRFVSFGRDEHGRYINVEPVEAR